MFGVKSKEQISFLKQSVKRLARPQKKDYLIKGRMEKR